MFYGRGKWMDLSVHGSTTTTTQGSTTIHLQLLVNIEGLRMMLNGGKCNIFGLYISVCYRRRQVVEESRRESLLLWFSVWNILADCARIPTDQRASQPASNTGRIKTNLGTTRHCRFRKSNDLFPTILYSSSLSLSAASRCSKHTN